MPTDFQGNDDLYKSGRQEQDPKRLAEIVKQYREMISANKDLDKLSNSQVKSLVAQEKNLERLEKRLISLRTKAVDPVAKAIESLTTRLSGGSGLNSALTKFAGTSAESIFQTDKLNDKVNVFGRTLDMSATTFTRYLGAFQLVIAATLRYLAFQDEAQRKQGQLMRSFGATNVSIATTYKTAAEGWRLAGSAGAEASEKLNEAIFRARGGTALNVGAGGEMEGYRKLLSMTAGFSQQVPTWITKLSEVFAVRDEKNVINQIEQLGAIAMKSGAPLEQMTNMVFDLAQQFAGLGVNVEDAQGMVTEFIDAVGQGKIAPVIGLQFAAQAMEERRTAGGVTGMAKTAWAIANQYEKLPEAVKKSLGKGFATMDIGRQMGVLQRMTDAQYQAAKMTAVYQQLSDIQRQGGGVGTMGEQAAKVAAQQWGVEWIPLQKAVQEVGYGVTGPQEFAKQFQDALKDQQEAFKEGAEVPEEAATTIANTMTEFQNFYTRAADLQAEWYSKIWGEIVDFKGTFISWVSGEKQRPEETQRVKATLDKASVLSMSNPITAMYTPFIAGVRTLGSLFEQGQEQEATNIQETVATPAKVPTIPTKTNRTTVHRGEETFDIVTTTTVMPSSPAAAGEPSKAVIPKPVD